VFGAACGGGDNGGTPPSACRVTSVTVGPDTLSVVVGESKDLFAAFAGVNCTASEPITWSASNTAALSLQPAGATAHVTGRTVSAQPVTVTATVAGVSGQSQVMVRQPPTIELTPDSIAFAATQNGPSPQSQAVAITNAGGGALTGVSAGSAVYGPEGSGWLLVQALFLNPTAPTSLNLVPTNTTLPPGTYTAKVPITSPAATNSPQNIVVTYTISANAAAPAISNLSTNLVALNGCKHSDNSVGNLVQITFAFTDPSGSALAGSAQIIETFKFVPSGVSGTSSGAPNSSTGTGASGTMSIGNCLTFDTDTSMSFTVTLVDGAGKSSNTLSGSIAKPAGGARTGPGRGVLTLTKPVP
jgi:hypothetical protein